MTPPSSASREEDLSLVYVSKVDTAANAKMTAASRTAGERRGAWCSGRLLPSPSPLAAMPRQLVHVLLLVLLGEGMSK